MREKTAKHYTRHRAAWRKGWGALFLGWLIFSLTGCVYLRLLEFQNQLAQFDQFFRVEVDGRFILHILEPKITSQDLIYLSSLEPSRREAEESGETWYYVFQKLRSDSSLDNPDTHITFALRFSEKQRLTAVTFSPLFLKIVPPEFLEQSIRSLGHADVDRKKRQLRANPESLPRITQALPGRSEIVQGLGDPFATEVKDQSDCLIYRYRLQPPDGGKDEDKEERRKAVVELLFNPLNGKLTKMDANFAGLKITIHYEKLAAPGSPQSVKGGAGG